MKGAMLTYFILTLFLCCVDSASYRNGTWTIRRGVKAGFDSQSDVAEFLLNFDEPLYLRTDKRDLLFSDVKNITFSPVWEYFTNGSVTLTCGNLNRVAGDGYLSVIPGSSNPTSVFFASKTPFDQLVAVRNNSLAVLLIMSRNTTQEKVNVINEESLKSCNILITINYGKFLYRSTGYFLNMNVALTSNEYVESPICNLRDLTFNVTQYLEKSKKAITFDFSMYDNYMGAITAICNYNLFAKINGSKTIANTSECYRELNDPNIIDDPCCSVKAAVKYTCYPRNITIPVYTLDETKIYCNSTSAKIVLADLIYDLNNVQRLTKSFDFQYIRFQKIISDCIDELTPFCLNDVHCPDGSYCETGDPILSKNYRCRWFDMVKKQNQYQNCTLEKTESMNLDLFFYLKRFFAGKSIVNYSQLLNSINVSITEDTCFGQNATERIEFDPEILDIERFPEVATCAAQQQCPLGNCSSGTGCFACRDTIGISCLNQIFSPSKCSSEICIYSKYLPGQIYHECLLNSYECTVPCGYKDTCLVGCSSIDDLSLPFAINMRIPILGIGRLELPLPSLCSQSECINSRGVCSDGLEFPTPLCYVDAPYVSPDFKGKCVGTLIPVSIPGKCINSLLKTRDTCLSQPNTTWYIPAKSEAECLSLKRCVRPDGLYTLENCSNMVPIYKWRSPAWIPVSNYYGSVLNLSVPRSINARQTIPNYNKYNTDIQRGVSAYFTSKIRTQFTTRILGPYINLAGLVQVCGGNQLYKLFSVNVLDFDVLFNSTLSIDIPAAGRVNVCPDCLTPDTNIQVSKVFAGSIVTRINQKRMVLEDSSNYSVVYSSDDIEPTTTGSVTSPYSSPIGQIIGNGLQISTASVGNITLTLYLRDDIPIEDESYVVYQIGRYLEDTDVPVVETIFCDAIVNATTIQCNIKGNGTYFPILITREQNPTPTTPVTPTPASSTPATPTLPTTSPSIPPINGVTNFTTLQSFFMLIFILCLMLFMY